MQDICSYFQAIFYELISLNKNLYNRLSTHHIRRNILQSLTFNIEENVAINATLRNGTDVFVSCAYYSRLSHFFDRYLENAYRKKWKIFGKYHPLLTILHIYLLVSFCKWMTSEIVGFFAIYIR